MRKFFTLFIAALCCATMFAEEQALPGKFTVNAEGAQVQFSPAPLYLGAFFGVPGLSENEQYEYYTYNTLYYAWGTGDDRSFTGNKSSFVDWGVNPIGSDTEGNLWRTMSADEWWYLLVTREHAEYLCGLAAITNQEGDKVYKGLMIFPDEAYVYADGQYLKFSDDLKFKHYKNEFTYSGCSEYTYEQWKQIEAYGAVFLQRMAICQNGEPISGSWSVVNENPDVCLDVLYWTSTPDSYPNAKALFIQNNTKANLAVRVFARNWQLPVRLVKNVDSATGIENIATPADKARKVMMDGTLYIACPDGAIYDAQGTKVK